MKLQVNRDFDTWPVVRSKPAPKAHGRSISVFINNLQCHLTTVDVFEDGSIDCWGFVDRELFKTKVKERWVVPNPNVGQSLSVHNFGSTGVEDGCWFQSPTSILTEVESILRTLNPGMQNLIDMHGSATEPRGKVQYAKMGLSDKKAFRVESSSRQEILAASVPTLRRLKNNAGFELTKLFAYTDGFLQVGTSGDLFEMSDLDAKFTSGELSNIAMPATVVALPGLGYFRATQRFGGVRNNDRVSEVKDMIDILQGKPSLLERCRAALVGYKSEPSLETKEALRAAYQAVPTHLRPYCGDMDTRDSEIRGILVASSNMPSS